MGLFSKEGVGNIHKIKEIMDSKEYARILDTNLATSS